MAAVVRQGYHRTDYPSAPRVKPEGIQELLPEEESTIPYGMTIHETKPKHGFRTIPQCEDCPVRSNFIDALVRKYRKDVSE